MSKLKSCGFLIFRDNPIAGSEADQSVEIPIGSDSGISPATGPSQTSPNHQISFLLLKHPNRWDLPKGHVDPGETNMECAIRELTEETGIQKQDLIIDPEFRYKQKYMVNSKRTNGKPKRKTLIIYAAKLIQPVELKLTEHDSFQWFDWAPPHTIQEKTIDPLLQEFQHHQQQVTDVLFVGGQTVSDGPKPCSE